MQRHTNLSPLNVLKGTPPSMLGLGPWHTTQTQQRDAKSCYLHLILALSKSLPRYLLSDEYVAWQVDSHNQVLSRLLQGPGPS